MVDLLDPGSPEAVGVAVPEAVGVAVAVFVVAFLTRIGMWGLILKKCCATDLL